MYKHIYLMECGRNKNWHNNWGIFRTPLSWLGNLPSHESTRPLDQVGAVSLPTGLRKKEGSRCSQQRFQSLLGPHSVQYSYARKDGTIPFHCLHQAPFSSHLELYGSCLTSLLDSTLPSTIHFYGEVRTVFWELRSDHVLPEITSTDGLLYLE